MGKIERALAECKERGEALEVGNDKLREKIVVLEQEVNEWERKCNDALEDMGKMGGRATKAERERGRLWHGLVGIPCSCVTDGTLTVTTECRRCAALGGDDG